MINFPNGYATDEALSSQFGVGLRRWQVIEAAALGNQAGFVIDVEVRA